MFIKVGKTRVSTLIVTLKNSAVFQRMVIVQMSCCCDHMFTETGLVTFLFSFFGLAKLIGGLVFEHVVLAAESAEKARGSPCRM